MPIDFFRENRQRFLEVQGCLEGSHARDLPAALRTMEQITDTTTIEVWGWRTRMTEVLEESHDRGRTRHSPQTIDAVVHPHWPWHPTGRANLARMLRSLWRQNSKEALNEQAAQLAMARWREDYAERTSLLLSQAPRPVIVDYPGATQDYHGFDGDSTTAVTSEDTGPTFGTGYLPARALARLLHAIGGFDTGKDRIRVSGAAFGGCPTAFLQQFWAAAQLGFFLHYKETTFRNAPLPLGRAQAVIRNAMARLDAEEWRGAQMRLLFDSQEQYADLKPYSLERLLMAEETVVVPTMTHNMIADVLAATAQKIS